MCHKWILTTIVCCALLWTAPPNALAAAEVATQKPEPPKNATTAAAATPATTTTPTPKIDIKASALCKKCICDTEIRQLDCSNKSMSSWFSDEEWQTLSRGDITFQTIKLDHNKLTTVPVLPAYPMTHLYLGYNQIENISLGAFQNLSELSILDLSHNKLTSKVMVPDVFKGMYSPQDYLPLDKIRELDLGYNELHNLDPDLFEHLPKLQVLILGGNIFHVIDHLTETAIAGLTSLKTLDLSYMELSDLPDNLLHGPRDLETLILSGNLLKELPDDIELGINLKSLVLDENPMGDLNGENVFPEFRQLTYLSISNMPELTKIGRGALSNLQNLTTLIASDNTKLSYIDAKAFEKNTTNPAIFDYPPLQKLYLHNNNLSYLEHGLVERWDKIEIIDLRFNPWACDCDNHWLIHVLMSQINTTTPLLTAEVECASPAAWNQVQLMDLNSEKKTLICENNSHPEKDSLILVGVLVGILVGIPLTIGALVLYKRGCLGLRKRGNSGDRALYNRASFTDDFHI